jgi:hypothetical protein
VIWVGRLWQGSTRVLAAGAGAGAGFACCQPANMLSSME